MRAADAVSEGISAPAAPSAASLPGADDPEGSSVEYRAKRRRRGRAQGDGDMPRQRTRQKGACVRCGLLRPDCTHCRCDGGCGLAHTPQACGGTWGGHKKSACCTDCDTAKRNKRNKSAFNRRVCQVSLLMSVSVGDERNGEANGEEGDGGTEAGGTRTEQDRGGTRQGGTGSPPPAPPAPLRY